jgi:ribokinase
MMYDIITIGGATLDIFFQSCDYQLVGNQFCLTYGGKHIAEEMFIDVGGGGANPAVGLSRQGYKTAFFGKIGQDPLGQLVLERLKREKVGKDFLAQSEKSSLSVVLVSNTGEKTLVMYRGNHDQLELTPQLEYKLKKTKWFYIADLRGRVFSLVDRIVDIAKENNVKVFFVPGVGELEWGLEKLAKISQHCEIIIMNIYELADLLGKNVEDLDMSQDYTQVFGTKITIITYDRKGSFAYDGFKIYREPARMVKAVDTTGAGDAYAVGFLAEFIRTGDISASMEMGTKNATSVITKIGAQTGLLRN